MDRDNGSQQQVQSTPLQALLGSRLVTGLGMLCGRYLPPVLGHALADLIAGLINRFKPGVYWILYENLRHVVEPSTDEEALHRMTRAGIRNTARNNYELWHLIGSGPEAIREAVLVPAEAQERFRQAERRGRGVIVAGAHTGNFDVAMLAITTFGLDVQILGMANLPGGGFALMDQMRVRFGIHVTSIGLPALREAIGRLRSGGIVATGVDRPVGDNGPSVEFFGQPAALPAGHIRLALKTDAAVIVGCARRDRQKRTVMELSVPVEMIYTGDADEDLRVNLRRVTASLEEAIRTKPDQWGMFVPVWPD
jgi:KDO2-lipid IV(A) lauroyltransferase